MTIEEELGGITLSSALAVQPDPHREELPPPRSVSVLLLEDNSLDALLVQNALRSASDAGPVYRYVSQWSQTLADARDALAHQRFELVIVDLMLPDSEGLATLAAVRAAAPGSAIVVITGQNDHRSAVEAMRLGAQDYLVKGEFTYPSLERAIRYALDRKAFTEERLRDQSERELLQEQLRQAQRMEALGRLAGGVAHDFNNVLTIILGHAAMMQGGIVTAVDANESLSEIRAAAERAARLTAQLLAFSKQQVSSPKVVNLDLAIADLEKMLGTLIGEHIELVTQFGPATRNVLIDPGHVEQILMNLAVNARDAMPDGGILTIRTSVAEVGDDQRRQRPYVPIGRYVQLSVVDTGVGMDEDVRARIFEPFFTTKEKGRGTGLGLSTVYGIVKQAGGYIWCTSVPKLGTRFDIYLPETDAPQEHEPVVMNERPVAAGERILIVEDNAAVRAIVTRTLGKAGYLLLEASSGDEALALAAASAEPIDVLLTDMVMPGIAGRDLARRVMARFPAIKVVYMSGYTDDEFVRRGELPRDHLFLQKPFTGVDLLNTVGRALAIA